MRYATHRAAAELEPRDRLTLDRLLPLTCDLLDSVTRNKLLPAAVQVAMAVEQRREEEAVPGSNTARRDRGGQQQFPSHPLL